MKSTSLVAGAVLFLAAATIASARSWDIAVDHTAQAGNMTVPSGDYTVRLKGTQATLTSEDSGKSYDIPVKIVNVDRKYDETAVVSIENNGTEVIESIELGGTATEIEFAR
jgi:uncharacterized protein RhaS with RHS repeats